MKPSPRPALTGPSIRSAFVAHTRSDGFWLGTTPDVPIVDMPSAPLPRMVTKGVPMLSETPPRVLVMGAVFSRDPQKPTPPPTWAIKAAGTAKYDRTPERPIMRRKWCISDSTEEVVALSGITRTTHAKSVTRWITATYSAHIQWSKPICHPSRTFG